MTWKTYHVHLESAEQSSIRVKARSEKEALAKAEARVDYPWEPVEAYPVKEDPDDA